MNESHLDCVFIEDAISVAVPSLYFILLLPALVLNGAAVWVSLHLRSTSPFMAYLKNLMVADLLMTLIMPLRATSLLPGSSLALEAFTCRYSSTFFYSIMHISIIFLGLISLDRFFKIVRPGGRLLGQNLVFCKVLSAFIWVFYLCSNVLPTIILTDQDPTNKTEGEFCMNKKSKAGKQLHNTVVGMNNAIFWAVFIVIVFCYLCIARKVYQSYQKSGSSNEEGKRKVKARVFVILIVFLVCFFPYNATRIPYIKLQVHQMNSCRKTTLRVIKNLTLWLANTNVCLDPLIYFFVCKVFKAKLCEINPLMSVLNTQTSQSNEESIHSKKPRTPIKKHAEEQIDLQSDP